MNHRSKTLIHGIAALALLAASTAATAQSTEVLLDQAIAGEHRSSAAKARDKYRHPRETLLFFGLKPDMTVVEIWPAGGWYTHILAPVLRDKGKLYLAHVAIENPKIENWQRESREQLAAVMAGKPEVYGKPLFTSLGPPEYVAIAPPRSADLVLTFRNVHNWSKQRTDAQVFKAFFDALKPGGVLGVVEHRAKPDTPLEEMVASGYMTEDYVIALAQKAGFRFIAKSEVNANPRDSKDHPHGVWTLPPMRRGLFLDAQKYLDIGESDRMTLKFEKPKS